MARLIALVFLCLCGLARAQGTYYDAPSTWMPTPPFATYVHDTRLWIPNDVTVIRGVIAVATARPISTIQSHEIT